MTYPSLADDYPQDAVPPPSWADRHAVALSVAFIVLWIGVLVVIAVFWRVK